MDLELAFKNINQLDNKLCKLIEVMTEDEYNQFVESNDDLRTYDDLLTDYEDLESMPEDKRAFFTTSVFETLNTFVDQKITELNI